MANIRNLKPIRTSEEAKEKGRRGGIASGISRRKRKQLRKDVRAFMITDFREFCNGK